MDILISWSKKRSKVIATAFKNWLPLVLPGVQPWMSAIDIAKGKEWFRELQQVLGDATACIICVTDENIRSPWIYYETGAIAARRAEVSICPYLLGIDADVVSDGPFGIWQCTFAEKDDTFALIEALNKALPEGKRHNIGLLKGNFETHWGSFHAEILRALAIESEKAGVIVTKGDKSSAPVLSESAQRLLSCAARSDHGFITVSEAMGGVLKVVTAGLEETATGESRARWKSAIDQLIRSRLVCEMGNHTFELTEEGWEIGKSLGISAAQYSDSDIKILLADWLARALGHKFGIPILVKFEDLDRELKLPSGSTN
jgi:hypothetical protein